jgi:putative ABC transport system ATP-binding protein
MTEPTPVIQLDAVTRVYRSGDLEIPVLHGIHLTIQHGEYAVLMGRSGSGKSTLMNILGLLDRPTAGTYRLLGQDIGSLDDDDLSALRGRTIGFVFQSFHLLNHLTIEQNVGLPMEYQGASTRQRHERATELLERVGLSHRLGHRPTQLSGGERQRVAIARALANQPRVLLADEPTGNLDSAAQRHILDLFAQLHREATLTLVMVTHDPAIGAAASRLIRVSDGLIVEGDAP